MSLRFRGGERLQRGRGIGGLLRLVKSVFSPFIKSAGKTIVRAATSDTGKNLLNTVKDQSIETSLHLTADALRGKDMKESVQNEVQNVKRKAADFIENVASKKQRKAQPKPKPKIKRAKIVVKPRQDMFG